MLLDGKSALVTGGSRGIGRAIAIKLASEGAAVAINYAGNAKAAEEVKSIIEAAGGKAMIVQADVSNGESVDAMIKEVVDTFGGIDILVNNAGVMKNLIVYFGGVGVCGITVLLAEGHTDFDPVVHKRLQAFLGLLIQVFRPSLGREIRSGGETAVGAEIAGCQFRMTPQDVRYVGGIVGKVEKGSNPPKLPSSATPESEIITEYFKRGTEPTEVSTKYLSVGVPTNLSVTNHGSYATISWTGIPNPDYVENDIFGYHITFNGKKYFTTSTTFTISNESSYYGTYTVRAGYKNTDASIGNVVSYELKQITYNLSAPSSVTYNVGETVNTSYYDGSGVTLTSNGSKITGYTINTTITDKNGNVVQNINSNEPNTYKITYKVIYNDYTGTCTNTIIIKEKAVVTPPPTPIPTAIPENNQNNNSDTEN